LIESTKFFLLLALAAAPNYAAKLRRQIIADTTGCYLGDGTLYEALASLVRRGYIEVAAVTQSRSNQRTYQLTARGRHILQVEALRFGQAAQLAQQRLG